MTSDRLRSLVRCPVCRGELESSATTLACRGCGRRYAATREYLDLRPPVPLPDTTKYVDPALHADGRDEEISPPLLSAGVRQVMLQKMLAPGPGDVVLDLGCGNGRALVWNQPSGAYLVGVDVSPFFAPEACATVDLVLADLRALPFADGVFTKAFALDVWEHLSRQGLARVLSETARVLAPRGQLFVYSHVRKNSPLAAGVRAVNRVARWLERAGAVDLAFERLRKSDHLNPLADLADLERTVAAAGFRLAAIRYYTPLVGAVVENLLVRVGEGVIDRLGRRRESGQEISGLADRTHRLSTSPSRASARMRIKRALRRGGTVYAGLVALTWLMRLDIVLFGRVPSGPFFALLVKEGLTEPP